MLVLVARIKLLIGVGVARPLLARIMPKSPKSPPGISFRFSRTIRKK